MPDIRGQSTFALLHALAYNLHDFLPIKDRSLISLKEKLIEISAKVVSHGRYVTFPDSRGRDSQKTVRRNFAADRRSTAADPRVDWVINRACP